MARLIRALTVSGWLASFLMRVILRVDVVGEEEEEAVALDDFLWVLGLRGTDATADGGSGSKVGCLSERN